MARASSDREPAGGGGGGLFGGGGGAAGPDALSSGAGGGGGSSFGPPGTTFAAATTLAPGSVTIAYVPSATDSPPSVVVTRPRAGQVIRRFSAGATARRRRQLVIAGRATDAAGVQGVALTIERLPRATTHGAATRCAWLSSSSGLRHGRCDQPSVLTGVLDANGSWTYRVSRQNRLPAGRYRVTAYGRDGTGLFGNAAPRRARVITFRLSRR